MNDYSYRTQADARAARRKKTRSLLIALGGAFVLGVAATGVVGWQTGYLFSTAEEAPAPLANAGPAAALPATQPTGGQDPVADSDESALTGASTVEEVAEQQGGLDQRLAALEQRITRLDIQAEAAAGNAARAEGLLIAFATRRALERGDRLGYLEEQLQLRFGEAQPEAVKTLIQVSENPITLDQLLARLEGLENDLMAAPADEGLFESIGRGLSELFVVRREDTPSPVPERRYARAQRFLESGRPSAAAAEVRNLPAARSEEVQKWLADAERYANAQEALETIESSAILEPRNLRDGEGNRVEQASPVSDG